MAEPVCGRRDDAAAARQLGAALRGLQQRSGRTLRGLEEQVRISDSSLSRYFRGDTVPPWPVVRDLCQALGADPSEYRALWEAADRTPAEPPPDAIDVSTAQPSALAWRRRLRTRLAGRRAFAAAGTLTGLLAGFLLALLVPRFSPAAPDPPGAASGAHARADETSANAPKPPGVARIFVSRATGSCLDASLDNGLRSYKCNGMPYQWWNVRSSADGTRQLRNHATGTCLDDSGAGLRTRPCGDSTSQKWTLAAQEDEAVRLRNAVTGKCLDESSAGLRALPCTTTRHQKWG